jgi:hypothetical protein
LTSLALGAEKRNVTLPSAWTSGDTSGAGGWGGGAGSLCCPEARAATGETAKYKPRKIEHVVIEVASGSGLGWS